MDKKTKNGLIIGKIDWKQVQVRLIAIEPILRFDRALVNAQVQPPVENFVGILVYSNEAGVVQTAIPELLKVKRILLRVPRPVMRRKQDS